MQSRRDFLKIAGSGIALTALGNFPLNVFASKEFTKLTILHTNDVHSRIDPFPMNDPKYPGLGGVARRAEIIKAIRAKEKNVLLLDAGDIFQGTPYFNLYGGEPELRLMSKMGYDATTIGNHDFDNGIENLAKRTADMNFPFLNANYDFSGTPMENKTLPYKIFTRGKIKIGIFGIGIELKGLVDPKLYGETQYMDPFVHAELMSGILKNDHKCDLVICLSHLGYKYEDKKISDELLAQQSSNIDLIIGGHTHTFLDKAVSYKNAKGKEVLVAQVGWAGIRLGRIDYFFNEKNIKKDSLSSTVKISENTIAA